MGATEKRSLRDTGLDICLKQVRSEMALKGALETQGPSTSCSALDMNFEG